MLSLNPAAGRGRLDLLCLGAHSDDIEIGCGGAVLRWLAEVPEVHVTWVVLSAPGERADEARRSAQALLKGAASAEVVIGDFTDAHFPSETARLKAFLSDIARRTPADVVLTHRLEDRHQDHRTVGELTWQTWRDHLVLEYEIPKYEGDLGQPNVYVPLPAEIAQRKVQHLMAHFGTQRAKGWFTEATFQGLMALRGIECRAPSGQAEAFHARKVVL
ncbi:PIG-L deacetylase family protein [Sphaerotilus sp.]|uniref:PIG-L deacetylase family protein n=1 Tax=Sphaerotilus sp. TaxID=2093942 RepID=UPI0025F3CEEA|nr:PIG-L deacetylase family protein [Sphaerotilus sp.]